MSRLEKDVILGFSVFEICFERGGGFYISVFHFSLFTISFLPVMRMRAYRLLPTRKRRLSTGPVLKTDTIF